MLPQPYRDALEVLVTFATDQWLAGQPPPEDLEHRHRYRNHCSQNFEVQLLRTVFRPGLGPEGGPDTSAPGRTQLPGARDVTTPSPASSLQASAAAART